MLLGKFRGDFVGALSFKEEAAYANPDLSLRGAINSQYSEVPRLHELDPTSTQAVSIDLAQRRDPKGAVGYTHEFVSLEYMSAISAQFASWFREYLTVANVALKAETDLSSGNYQLLDMELDVRYGDGHVAAFYAAVGDFNSSLLSYPASQPLSVAAVHDKVLASVQEYIDVLDQVGYSAGESATREVVGLGSLPQSGVPVAFLSSNTVDRLYRAPWARILRVPRARDLVERQLMSRLDLLNASATNMDEADFVTITEGDDTFVVPVDQTFDELTTAIDARGVLSHTDYYTDSAKQAGSAWLGQFHTKGELVAEILEGNFDILGGGSQCIALSPLAQVGNNAIIAPRSLDTPMDTGPLSSYNTIVDHIAADPKQFNWIHGSNDVHGLGANSTAGSALLDPTQGAYLPNGILYCGVLGEATAIDWVRILRALKLNYPIEAKTLLTKTGRSKKTLPKGAPTVASSDSLLSEAIANGQRDGYLNFPMMAFNTSRKARTEQEGPFFAASGEALSTYAGGASSFIVSQYNGWDRSDSSAGKFVLDPQGNQIDFTGSIPARFSGEWDAGRFASWQPDLISESLATGPGSIEERIAENLLSYPGIKGTGRTFTPRYIPNSPNTLQTLTGNYISEYVIAAADVEEMTAISPYNTLYNSATHKTGMYTGGVALESIHPTRGFMRGFANYHSEDPYNNVSGDPVIPRLVCNRTYLQNANQGTVNVHIDGTPTPYFQRASVYNYKVAQDASLTGASAAAPDCKTWLWDPTRAQIVGNAWHRWAGHLMAGALPHPYVPMAIAAFPAAAELGDLTKLGTLASRPCSYYVHVDDARAAAVTSPDATQAVSLAGLGSGTDRSKSTKCTSAEVSGMSSVSFCLPVNGSASNNALVGDLTANKLTKKLWNMTSDPMTKSMVSGDVSGNLTALPIQDMVFPVVNGCSRKGTLTTTGHTLQSGWSTATPVLHAGVKKVIAQAQTLFPAYDSIANNHSNNGVVVTTASGSEANMNVRYEGEVLVPIKTTQAGAGPRPAANLIIDGKGFNFADDIITHTVMDGLGWLKSLYNADGGVIMNSFQNAWPVSGNANGAITEVELPNLGHNYSTMVGDITDEHYDALGVARNYELNGSHDDWFRKGAVLTGRHARLRAKTLVNPWVRPIGKAGIFNLQYMTDGVLPNYLSLGKSMLTDGRAYQAGLINSTFLEAHMAN